MIKNSDNSKKKRAISENFFKIENILKEVMHYDQSFSLRDRNSSEDSRERPTPTGISSSN
jgi:hypothetical protein